MQIALHIFITTTLLLSTCSIRSSDEARNLTAEIVGISDGDTVIAFFPEERILRKIRLAMIDAPEFKQPFGKKSRKSLSDLVYKQKVIVRPDGEDRYGRMLAELIVNDVNVNVEQIRRGFAWHYKYYARTQNYEKHIIYSQAETMAREKRVGIWQLDNPVPPWIYRKKHKSRKDKLLKSVKVG